MTLEEIKSYFESIANSHTEINSFQYGGLERILNRQLEPETDYPLLFLETPSFNFSGTAENASTKPSISFAILCQAPSDDIEAQDNSQNVAFEIAIDIISKMNEDYISDNTFKFSLQGSRLDPVDTITLSGDIGWRFEFTIEDPLAICFNPLKWN